MVPAKNQEVLIKHGRTAFAMGMQCLHPAKILLPFEIAFQVEAIEAAGAVAGVDVLAIGHRRVGSQAAGLVTTLMRKFGANHFFPKLVTITTANRHKGEFMVMGYAHIVVRPRRVVINRFGRLANRGGHREKDLVAKNDRCGMAFAGQRYFPADVLFLAPLRSEEHTSELQSRFGISY